MSRGTCKNGSRDTDNEIAESVAVLVDPSPTCEESAKLDGVTSDDFIDAKLTRAFGASILRSDGGGFNDQWGSWWIRACHMSGSQYDLPLVEQLVVNLLIYLLLRFSC